MEEMFYLGEMKSSDGLGGWMLGVWILGLPVLLLPGGMDPYFPVRMVVLVASMVVGWVLLRKEWGELIFGIHDVVGAAILTLLVVMACSALMSLHPVEGFLAWGRWVVLIGLLYLCRWYAGNVVGWMLMAGQWMVGTTCVVGGIWLLQWMGWLGAVPEKGGDAVASTLGNVNFLAGMMLLLVPGMLMVVVRGNRVWRVLGMLGIVLAVLCMVGSDSTGAWLGLGAAAGMMGLGALVQWRGIGRRGKLALLLGMFVLAGALGGYRLSWMKIEGVDVTAQQVDSGMERLVLWKASLEMVAEHPVLGVGPGHWNYYILEQGVISQYQDFGSRFFMQAHNDFLQVFAEVGVVGGLAFLVVALGGIVMGWMRLRKGVDGVGELVALGGWSGWCVFAFFNLPLERPELVMLGLLYLGYLYRREGSQVRKTNGAGQGAAVGLIVVACVVLVVQVLKIPSDRLNGKMVEAKARQAWPEVLRWAEKAEAWYNPHEGNSGTPIAWFKGVALVNMGRFPEGLKALEDALRISPWHPHALANKGVALAQVGDLTGGRKVLEEVVRIYPSFHEARQNLTEVNLMLGDAAGARRVMAYWGSHVAPYSYQNYYAAKVQWLDSLAGR